MAEGERKRTMIVKTGEDVIGGKGDTALTGGKVHDEDGSYPVL